MKQLLFGILLLTLMSCNRLKTTQVPADVMPRDSMVSILVDIHVADAVADQKFGQDKPNRAFANGMYERIFEIHHTTAALYKTSFKYYESHPEILDKMYEQVITEISKREAELKKAK